MGKFFVHIYDYFQNRRVLLFGLLASTLLVMGYFAVQVRFEEDINSFFPDGKDQQKTMAVFKNLKVKDKIFLLFTAADSLSSDPDRLIEAADSYCERLMSRVGESHIRSLTAEVDQQTMSATTDFIYNNLPIFLTERDYQHLDSMLSPEAVRQKMESNYATIVSPMGIAVKDVIVQDPLGLGMGTLAELRNFGQSVNYQMYDGRIFSEDFSTMLVMLEPRHGAGSTGANDALITAIEEIAALTTAEFSDLKIEYFGGPSIGVYNARQIKKDTMVTLTVAMLIIIVFLTLAFRNRWAVVLIVLPVLYGALFALALIYFIRGEMSAIAIGAGATVFGIAMSYSIHVIAHRNHAQTIRQIIEELAYPLTVGSFTTIGAFIGLLFTTSNLLRDFGLFAALTLVGTTVFTLIFLPHLMRERTDERPNPLLKAIERLNAYAYDRNRWLLGVIVVVTVVCLFTYKNVRFDSDMMHLSIEPTHIKSAEKKLNDLFNADNNTVLFVSAESVSDSAIADNARVNRLLRELQRDGYVESVMSADKFLVPQDEQARRIERWNRFWTPEKRQQVESLVNGSAVATGFAPDSFLPFAELLYKQYIPLSLNDPAVTQSPLFKDLITSADSLSMLITKVTLPNEYKDHVYSELSSLSDAVIVDRAHFSNKMAVVVNNDFYLILYISSFLIFFALLISYGRIELAALAFAPMALSWVIILGLMAIFGIEFNIVNIILSTFIFGIGDDFSIFIMDGLLSEYRTGKRMLASHKTAIFFSAFTTIVGMGALIFAGHPALKSISLISIMGMIAVVVISYTVQPILFRWLISAQTRKGGFPFTLMGILNSLYAFLLFLLGCLILQLLIVVLLLLPLSRRRKKYIFHSVVSKSTYIFMRMMITVKVISLNPRAETFDKPAVIIANHQSFIDILLLLALNRKSVMVTNGWVWRSPFFGRIVRYSDFYHTADGYEALADTLRERVAEGYSVIVFPEGTRSADCTIKRFHKGAFYLAEMLKLDIVPIVQFGNGLISSKRQPFFIKKGIVVTKILPRIACSDTAYGTTYKERCKRIEKYFRAQYDQLAKEYGTPENPYYYDALIKSYTYKGPVVEWYMRIKVRLEHNYKLFNELVPRQATVTDIGCGYGPLVFALGLYAPKRRITGIDYDPEKIAVANHSFLKNDRLTFIAADALDCQLPESDVFIMNDMLHYLDYDRQRTLIERCISKLNTGGVIIIRDGDADKEQRHRVTQLTEKFSTEICKFNKTEGELHFTSTQRIAEIASANGMSMEQLENDRKTSNTIFILRKR